MMAMKRRLRDNSGDGVGGFTYVETMVALAIACFAIAGFWIFMNSAGRTADADAAKAEAARQCVELARRLREDLRSASALSGRDGKYILTVAFLEGGKISGRVVAYEASGGKVTRTDGSGSRVLFGGQGPDNGRAVAELSIKTVSEKVYRIDFSASSPVHGRLCSHGETVSGGI